MSTKSLVWIFMTIGSVVGGYIPGLWGDSMFSMSSIVLSAVFALVGIWFGFKLGQGLN